MVKSVIHMALATRGNFALLVVRRFQCLVGLMSQARRREFFPVLLQAGAGDPAGR